MYDFHADLRRQAISIEITRRVLRALAAPRAPEQPIPSLSAVAAKLGIAERELEASLFRQGLVQDGVLTEKGLRWALQTEANRVCERWDSLVRWYVRLRTLAEANPPEARGNVVIALQDYALQFLSECLAFRDWLLRASEAPLRLFEQSKVEALYNDMDLHIGSDLGIELKHMYVEHPGKRNARAKVDAHPGVRDVPAAGGGLELLVFVGGDTHDLLAIAKDCYRRLREFVRLADVARQEARELGEIRPDAPRGPSAPMMVTVPELGPALLSAEP